MANRNRLAEWVRLDRCPEYRDPRALLELGIDTMVRVSQCDDLALALKASQWLIEYAESLMNSKRQAKEETASTVSPLRVC